MMSGGERRAFFTVLAVLAVALTFMLMQSLTGGDSERVYHVTVLTDGSDENYWKSFRKGVEQAAKENNVDVRYVTRYDGDPAVAQMNALRLAWQEETDGVVVVPVDGDALALALMEAPQQLGVTVTGTTVVTAHTASTVTADNRAMGMRLADAVAGSGVKACTVFVPYRAGTAVSQRYEGLSDRLAELGISHGRVETADVSRELLAPDYALVALEPATTEALCLAPGAAGRVYGVGTSNRLLRALEEGEAAALVVQSDYAAGYISLLRTIEGLKGRPERDVVLDSYTVNKDNMFTEPLVQLLFPIA